MTKNGESIQVLVDSNIPCISRDLKKVSKCLKKNYKENTYNCPETIVPKKLSYAGG